MNSEIQNNWLAVLFTALMIVIPWSLAGMQILLGLNCIGFLIISVLQRRNLFRFHRFYIFVLIYLLLLIISALVSKNPAVAFNDVLHTNWIILTLPFIVSIPLTVQQRIQAIKSFLISAALVGCYGILQFFIGIDIFRGTELGMLGSFYRATGAYSFYLTFAGNQLMAFGLAFVFLMNKDLLPKTRWYYALLLLIILLSVIATYGRSAWLGAAFLIIFGTFLLFRKHFWQVMAIGITLVIIMSVALPDIRERIVIIFDLTHEFNAGRVNLWLSSLEIIKDYPILGVGPGLFEDYFQLYKVPGLYMGTGHAHNDYLHVAVQTGILGLLSWLAIWITFFYYGFKHTKDETRNKDDRIITSGIMLSISGILVAALFQCYFVDLENSILWWVLIGTALQILNKKTNSRIKEIPNR